MPLSNDFSLVYNGLTIGEGTDDYTLGAEIGGLGMPGVRDVDGARGYPEWGDIGGIDGLEPRILTFPVGIRNDSCGSFSTRRADTGANLQVLLGAWRPVKDDSPLDLRVPGLPETEVRFYGRPRGVDAKFQPGIASIPTMLTFKAMDPLKYGAEVTETTDTITNLGDATTLRAVITITGDGGTPVITNTSDGNGYVAFAGALGAAEVRHIDLLARTCVDDLGDDHYDELAPGITWFTLLSGVNTLTLAGAGSMSTVYRPAWL